MAGARTLSTTDKARRKKRKDTSASEKTQADYRGKCALLDRALGELQGQGRPVSSQDLAQVLSRYAGFNR